MNKLLLLAKCGVAFVWLVLLANPLLPFSAKASIVLYILTVFLLFMHSIQLLIFIGAFGDKVKLSSKQKWGVIFFGIFELLSIHKQHFTVDTR